MKTSTVALAFISLLLVGCCQSYETNMDVCMDWVQVDNNERVLLWVTKIDDHSERPQLDYEQDRRETLAWMHHLHCPADTFAMINRPLETASSYLGINIIRLPLTDKCNPAPGPGQMCLSDPVP